MRYIDIELNKSQIANVTSDLLLTMSKDVSSEDKIYFHVSTISLKEFNAFLDNLSKIYFPCEIVVEIKRVTSYPSSSLSTEITKGKFVNIYNLPDNVKLNFGRAYINDEHISSQSLSTWIHNLNDEEFKNFIDRCVYYGESDKSRDYLHDNVPHTRRNSIKKALLEERKIINEMYLKFKSSYPNFDSFSDTKKMDIIYNYVSKNIKYTGRDMLNSRGGIDYNKNGVRENEWLIADPIETYKFKGGVCSGRSSLIKMLANNYLVGINCYVSGGYVDSLGHQWNEFIDENNNAYFYDASYGRSHQPISLESQYYRIIYHSNEIYEKILHIPVELNLDVQCNDDLGYYIKLNTIKKPRPLPREENKNISKRLPRPLPREENKNISKRLPRPLPREENKNVSKRLPRPLPREENKNISKRLPRPLPREENNEYGLSYTNPDIKN